MLKAFFKVCVLLACLLIFFFVQAQAQVQFQIGILVDGSSSITDTQFDLIKNTLAFAIEGARILPLDGTVEITFVEFSDTDATVVVAPTVLNSQTATTIASQIREMVRGGGGTPLWLGLDLITDQMTNNLRRPTQPRDTLLQVINIITDGQPQIPNDGILPDQGNQLSLTARNRALSRGIDEISVEAVGIGRTNTPFRQFLLSFVWPQPGVLIENFAAPESDFKPGFVALVQEFAEIERVFLSKLRATLQRDDGTLTGDEAIPFDNMWLSVLLIVVFLTLLLFRSQRTQQL